MKKFLNSMGTILVALLLTMTLITSFTSCDRRYRVTEISDDGDFILDPADFSAEDTAWFYAMYNDVEGYAFNNIDDVLGFHNHLYDRKVQEDCFLSIPSPVLEKICKYVLHNGEQLSMENIVACYLANEDLINAMIDRNTPDTGESPELSITETDSTVSITPYNKFKKGGRDE